MIDYIIVELSKSNHFEMMCDSDGEESAEIEAEAQKKKTSEIRLWSYGSMIST